VTFADQPVTPKPSTKKGGQQIPTRNTPLLTQIIEVLGDLVSSPAEALARLEERFKDALLINAGDVQDVARHAEKLRLTIITTEAAQVLDHIGQTSAVQLTIDHVEDAINTLFEDRFIEP
jgi:hypothetical protein